MNTIKVSGTITEEPVFTNEKFGEKFYKSFISVERTSGTYDVLPIVVSELLVNEIRKDEKITLFGEIRTWNRHEEDKTFLMSHIFVQSTDEYEGHDSNKVSIDGFICKKPVYRTTPKGCEITDMILASNRQYPWVSDYIPCVTWGRNARRADHMEVGTEVLANGRFQSRSYIKRADGTLKNMIAYEVSYSQIEVIKQEDVANE